MIAVYVHPEAMTVAQYNKVHERLQAAGAPESGRKQHACFGEDGHLMVFDVWESQEAFDAFAQHLVPILQDEGVTGPPPTILPVVNLIQ